MGTMPRSCVSLHRSLLTFSEYSELLTFTGGVEIPVELLISFIQNGIYHIGGPNFIESTLPRLCAIYGEPICSVATASGERQANSVVLQMHFTQNS